MSNVVQFLEALACNPKPMSSDDFLHAISLANLDTTAQEALISRNAQALSNSIGGRLSMMCMIVPAENDEPQQDEGPQREEEDSPEQETSRAA